MLENLNRIKRHDEDREELLVARFLSVGHPDWPEVMSLLFLVSD